MGTPTAKSEEEIANDFVGFLENFQTTFGIKNFKIYVTGKQSRDHFITLSGGLTWLLGESYAGRYVPYISAAILNKKDTTLFNLKGNLPPFL